MKISLEVKNIEREISLAEALILVLGEKITISKFTKYGYYISFQQYKWTTVYIDDFRTKYKASIFVENEPIVIYYNLKELFEIFSKQNPLAKAAGEWTLNEKFSGQIQILGKTCPCEIEL